MEITTPPNEPMVPCMGMEELSTWRLIPPDESMGIMDDGGLPIWGSFHPYEPMGAMGDGGALPIWGLIPPP